MDVLVNLFLPLALAFIMFSLGLGLTSSDFALVARRPKAFGMGAFCQVALLPLVAVAIILAFDIKAEWAMGFMILAVCPGGVTSNMISKLARADVALSVSLTAVISLLSVVTAPLVLAWSMLHFMGEAAISVDVGGVAVAMFLLTVAPVGLGMLARRACPETTRRLEPGVVAAAAVLFAVIVVGALAANWSLFLENLPKIGPALILLNLAMLALGLGLSRLVGLPFGQAKTVSIEAGVQNSTLGIAVAALLAPTLDDGLGSFALPAALYGVLMYLVTLPVVAGYRRHADRRRIG